MSSNSRSITNLSETRRHSLACASEVPLQRRRFQKCKKQSDGFLEARSAMDTQN